MNTISRNIPVQFYVNEEEQESLNRVVRKNHTSISEYIRDKIFCENKDIDSLNVRYIVPSLKRHNLITTTLLFRTIQLIKQSLYKQGCSEEEILQMDNLSVESAKNQRAKNGYEVINVKKESSDDA